MSGVGMSAGPAVALVVAIPLLLAALAALWAIMASY
jgi:hypothetical protein